MQYAPYMLVAAAAASMVAAASIFGFLKPPPPPPLFTVQTARTTQQIVELGAQCTLSTRTPPRGGIIGIGIAGITPLTDARIVTAVKDLAVPWVGVVFIWSELERADGTYDWGRIDPLIVGLMKNNVNVLGVVNYHPAGVKDWATAEARFQKFLTALVGRYKVGGELANANAVTNAGVSHWEIFNEPNLPGFGWGYKGMNTANYVDEYFLMLALANKTIRANDPGAIIVLGGLSRDGLSPDTFLSAFYTAGFQKCVDVLGFHPYGYVGQLSALEDSLESYVAAKGDPGKTIWFNESGTNNDSGRAALLRTLAGELPNLNAFFWFSLQDLGTASGKNYGLIRLNFTRKPDFDLFKSLFGKK
jgi:hypothetical protein